MGLIDNYFLKKKLNYFLITFKLVFNVRYLYRKQYGHTEKDKKNFFYIFLF